MSLPPDIFYFGFEHQPELERHFASLGRLLALAQRFESGRRVLAYIVFRKRNPEIILGGPDELRSALREIYKQKLSQHIRAVAGIVEKEEEIRAMLDAARIARNEVAHQAALGFEHLRDEPEKLPNLLHQIRESAVLLARGDRWVSLVSSVLTHEPVPTADSLRQYPDEFANWVVGGDGA